MHLNNLTGKAFYLVLRLWFRFGTDLITWWIHININNKNCIGCSALQLLVTTLTCETCYIFAIHKQPHFLTGIWIEYSVVNENEDVDRDDEKRCGWRWWWKEMMMMMMMMMKRESRQSPHIGCSPTHSYKATAHTLESFVNYTLETYTRPLSIIDYSLHATSLLCVYSNTRTWVSHKSFLKLCIVVLNFAGYV